MRSLSLKLILSFLIVSLVGTALVVLLARFRTANEFGSFLFAQNRDDLVAQLSGYYRNHDSWDGLEEVFSFPDMAGMMGPGGPPGDFMPGGRFAIIDENGQVVLGSPGFPHGDRVGESTLGPALPILVDEREVGRLILGSNVFRVNQAGQAFLERINQVLLLSAIGATVVGLLLGVVLARTFTRPLREMIAATRAVADGDLEQRVAVRSGDELGKLAVAFNQMNDRLAHARDLRRQMTADIAHELRTPISVILGHAEAVHDGVMSPSTELFDIIHDEASRLSRLVEELRTLSLAEAGELVLTRQTISPKALLENAIAAHLPNAQQRGITLNLEIEPDLTQINVDPDRMAQVLSNVLSNALRYTPQGGYINLCAKRFADGVELRIQDSGPGIDPEELERIFDRFYRSDKSRQRDESGSGLGLAIAKSIVEGHNGRIWAESEPGQGVTIVIALPVQEKSVL
jgi:two-component system sensor histidine kinase BaeS